jgi:putative ABC transport system permease protein
MLAVTFADLWFRARQFLIAVVGVGLTLSLALALSGLAEGFHAEAEGAVDSLGATSLVMAGAAHGRLTAFAAFPEPIAASVAAEPGVHRVSPILFVPGQVVQVAGNPAAQTVNLVGVEPRGLGEPAVASGHPLDGTNQAVVDTKLRTPLGSSLRIGGQSVRVVGTVEGRTLTGGVPLVYMSLAVVQQVVTGGKPLITAVATTGTPARVPRGFVALTPATVVTDTVGQLSSAVASIDNTRWLMWILAVAIVASMLYVAALERKRDFAVLKALGASSRALFGSLVLEAVVVTLLAALLAEVLAAALTPLFSQPVDITAGPRLLLPVIAVVVGAVASVSALRRVTGADPATAFG